LKLEVIGRCDGDEKTRMTTQNQYCWATQLTNSALIDMENATSQISYTVIILHKTAVSLRDFDRMYKPFIGIFLFSKSRCLQF